MFETTNAHNKVDLDISRSSKPRKIEMTCQNTVTGLALLDKDGEDICRYQTELPPDEDDVIYHQEVFEEESIIGIYGTTHEIGKGKIARPADVLYNFGFVVGEYYRSKPVYVEEEELNDD